LRNNLDRVERPGMAFPPILSVKSVDIRVIRLSDWMVVFVHLRCAPIVVKLADKTFVILIFRLVEGGTAVAAATR
jgi:hypothetical protein